MGTARRPLKSRKFLAEASLGKEKIVVMGMGYIGLPTATVFAAADFDALGVDVKKEVVNTINGGNIHIVEPDLDIAVRDVVSKGKLRASLSPEKGDVFILAVPTPFKKEQGDAKKPDIAYVEAATEAICPFLDEENLVILESTSPVGTTERVHEIIRAKRPDLKRVYVAHCPERVLPGRIMTELVENDRIVGGIDEASAQKAKALYKSFCKGEIITTDSRTAEMSKLVENSYRDVNIAFANEL
ncbi:nucleotide sugar dehydrogenase, partial [bacterium]